MSPFEFPEDPVGGSEGGGGANVASVTALALAYAADPGVETLAALVAEAIDLLTATFTTGDYPGEVTGNKRRVLYHQANGLDLVWCDCANATDATDTAAALNLKMSEEAWSPSV